MSNQPELKHSNIGNCGAVFSYKLKCCKIFWTRDHSTWHVAQLCRRDCGFEQHSWQSHGVHGPIHSRHHNWWTGETNCLLFLFKFGPIWWIPYLALPLLCSKPLQHGKKSIFWRLHVVRWGCWYWSSLARLMFSIMTTQIGGWKRRQRKFLPMNMWQKSRDTIQWIAGFPFKSNTWWLGAYEIFLICQLPQTQCRGYLPVEDRHANASVNYLVCIFLVVYVVH